MKYCFAMLLATSNHSVADVLIMGLVWGAIFSAIGLVIRFSKRSPKVDIAPDNNNLIVQTESVKIPSSSQPKNNVPHWYGFATGYRRLIFVSSLYMTVILPTLSILYLVLLARYWHDEDMYFAIFGCPIIGFCGTWLIAYIIKLIIMPSIRYVKAGFSA